LLGEAMKRWLVIIALSLMAVALNLSLLEYGKSITTTYVGYRTISTRSDKPILFVAEVADTFCPTGKPDEPCAFATLKGFFPRPGVPRVVALLFGAALPSLLVIAAVAYCVRRRWVVVTGLCVAALVLFGILVDVPGRYFEAPIGTNIHQQIATDAIWTSHVDAGTENCCPAKWVHAQYCTKHEYAFVNGAFPTRGVPRFLAIGAGMALPLLLVLTALVVAIRRRGSGP